jgi:hypothetical protein
MILWDNLNFNNSTMYTKSSIALKKIKYCKATWNIPSLFENYVPNHFYAAEFPAILQQQLRLSSGKSLKIVPPSICKAEALGGGGGGGGVTEGAIDSVHTL